MIVSIAAVLVVMIPVLGKIVGANFMPPEDSSEFAINLRTPPGYSLEHTDAVVREMEARVRAIPEVRHMFTTVGDTTGAGNVTIAQIVAKLTPVNERRRSQQQVMADARRLVAGFPAMRVSVDDIKPWEQGGFREADVEYDVRGPDLEKLQAIIAQLRAQMKNIPGVLDIDSTYEAGIARTSGADRSAEGG